MKGVWIATQTLPLRGKYILEGRRKLTGHNGTGENTVSSLRAGEILGSQRRENNVGRNQGRLHE